MRAPRLIRTAAFRLALLFAGVFVVGAAVLVVFFDVAVSEFAHHDLREEVASEVELLQRTVPGSGAESIAQLVRQRMAVIGDQQFLYLVTSPTGRVLAGSLPANAAQVGLIATTIQAPANAREYERERAHIDGVGVSLPGGGILVVARSLYDFHELRETLLSVTIAAAVVITLLSLGVAMLIGRHFLSRIDRVSAAAGSIMDGKLDERLPAIGTGDEFDRLALSLNAMLDRIQALMEGLRQVSSDIAHDLRTPLTRLRRRLEDALAHEGEPTKGDAVVGEALAQVDEILATFGALLRIAQVEGGALRAGFKSVDLTELTDRVRQIYEPVAEDHGQHLTADLGAGVIIAGDAELLTQLVSNLIENAFAHAPASGDVGLRLGVEEERAVLEVHDHGQGVPPEEREKVLRRFYRLDHSRATPGAGLGLAMVQAVALAHGGEVALLDNKPGLVVRVSFPIAGP